MKANELRIGNLVSMNTAQGGWWIDHEVCACDFGVTLAGTLLCESFEPIPLTEEWLDDLGVIDKRLPKSGFEVLRLGKIFNITKEEREGNQGFVCSVKYVHELQNLYFSLTGNELTIKP